MRRGWTLLADIRLGATMLLLALTCLAGCGDECQTAADCQDRTFAERCFPAEAWAQS